MKRILTIVAVALSLSWGSFANADEFDDAQAAYLAAGQAIIDMVNGNSVDVAAVESNVITAVSAGVVLAKGYIVKHPEGQQLLEEVMNAALSGGAIGPMGSLSFAEVEADWHDAAHFADSAFGVDMDDEDNEHYLDPIHTIVHPVMVLIAAKDHANGGGQGSLDAMKAEMQEGMEQAENTTGVVKG